MIRRRLLNGTSACTTSFVAEPKHFPDPYWRGIMFGYDVCRDMEFQGLQARVKICLPPNMVSAANYAPQLVIL